MKIPSHRAGNDDSLDSWRIPKILRQWKIKEPQKQEYEGVHTSEGLTDIDIGGAPSQNGQFCSVFWLNESRI